MNPEPPLKTDQPVPVPRIPATQWMQENAALRQKQEEAEKAKREEAAAKVKADASALVDAFMLLVANGRDPWETTRMGSYELDMGSGDKAVLDEAVRELNSLGYKAKVRHPSGTGPGGRGKMEESWTDEKTWNLYVMRPGGVYDNP